MLRTWKLLAARRDLATALKFEEQRRDEMQHLREIVVPKIEQRIVAAEFAMLQQCHAALANPRTPASQASQLMTLLVQRQAAPSERSRWWSLWHGTAAPD
ncbi:MAG TPA: hypothetical protein VF096_17395 [Azonexus sp.]